MAKRRENFSAQFGRWKDATVICIASGPSLTDDQIAIVRAAHATDRCRVIAVNDNWKKAPFADVLYACDDSWWQFHIAAIRQSKFAGELWTASRSAQLRHRLMHVHGISRPGLSQSLGVIHHGGNSGYQAIGLAHQFGAARIVLIGYDMQKTGGSAHWFGNHPPGFHNAPSLARWVTHFDQLAADLRGIGVEVINCTRETALACFTRDNLENVF